ncbi:MAG: benzoyl-CoA 2,3-epoxidase subunit BoxA [Archangiaceae bacterium]|nr:benzoyl-CoA 2,3-epoxidase subunit BoxA [Archangiaceae bacterium]
MIRQHLIDPEVCIRCNTCEETCPHDAITHDRQSYAVDAAKCVACGDCQTPCPTGAIASWRRVNAPYPVAAQLSWESLPLELEPAAPADLAEPAEVQALTAQAHRAVGVVPPPWSAAHPYVGLYTEARPAIATVTGTLKLTADGAASDIRHLVLDFGSTAFPVLEGQSVGVLPEGLDADGRPHHVRLYSVASPRDGERPRRNNLALTVKRVVADREGRPVKGVASNYLCDLKKGDTVKVTGPWGASFLMPNHPGARLLMICTGTGAAPMRAMTERRRRRLQLDEGGSIHLFFGARNPAELPYFGPLMKLPRQLIDVELAFSRVPGQPKAYVQDRLRARGPEVAALLAGDDTFVYLCGHKAMEREVLATFAELLPDFPSRLETLKAAGRFHVETY